MCVRVVLCHPGNRFHLIKNGCLVKRSPVRRSLKAKQYSSHRPALRSVISAANESLSFRSRPGLVWADERASLALLRQARQIRKDATVQKHGAGK